MCDSPYSLPNPNFGHNSLGFKDVESRFIKIPCGRCPTCLHLKQEYFIQRFQMECLENDLWTGMLSYNSQMLPRAYINGFRHSFADSRDVQLLTRRLRNINLFNGPFKYWFISERGSKGHRPHWHFLISTPKVHGEWLSEKLSREKKYHDTILDNWYINIGSKRKPLKKPLLTYVYRNGFRNYDFHYVNPSLSRNGSDDVGFYTSKYYLKDDDYTKRLRSALRLNLPEVSFKIWWSFLRNKHLSSHYLGDYNNPIIRDYLYDCIDFSLRFRSPYPLFVNPTTGQTFPMSPYYRNRLCTPDIMRAFHANKQNVIDGVSIDDDIDVQCILNRSSHFKKVSKLLNFRDLDFTSLINNSYDYETDFISGLGLSQDETSLGQDFVDFGGCHDFDDSSF